MLSYEDSQSVNLPYDRFNDTDPDNAGDQLVDFSKRYPENDIEEGCRPSSAKNSQLSLTSMNCEENKQPDDELKIFCVEGTPGIASYASSCCDLREVGINEPNSKALISEEQTRKECCFSLPPDFSIGAPDSTKNFVDSNLVADEAGKRESNKEEESINLETEGGLTKSSSPLMFSRSSSVGSLNSFEQHSIVDDRSSLSAFSNLASGLISPSEIPDSPCGVESPFISKSKNNEFVFPSNDKSVVPVLVDQTICHEDFQDEAFGDLDDVKIYDDEGDCPSVSNLSALSIQANSTHESISINQIGNELVTLTQKLPLTVNCSITDGETDFIEKYKNLRISGESYTPDQGCINTKSSLPSDVKDITQSEKPHSIIESKFEDKGTSTSEDFHFHDPSYKLTSFPFNDMDTFTSVSKEAYKQLLEKHYLWQQNEDKQLRDSKAAELQRLLKEFKELMDIDEHDIKTYLLQNKSSNYSKDNSDDESNGILEECVLSEMPSKDNSMFNNSKQSLNHSYQTSGSSLKDDAPNCSLSDNDISDDDEDEGILNECVLLGMPQKSNSVQIETEKSSVLEVPLLNSVTNSKSSISNSPNQPLKLYDDAYQSIMPSQEKHIMNQESSKKNSNLVFSETVSSLRSFAKEEEFSTFNLLSHSEEQNGIKDDLTKSDDDSDIDESDLLVQQCIQLGRSELRNPKVSADTKLCGFPSSNKALGSRDNWPDGVSDGDDDDDDMLNEIIKAGKPNSEANKSPYSLKPQNRRKLTAAEDRALYLNKDDYGNIIPKEIVRTACASANALIGIDDSTYVYRTEDTPILSPTASLSDLSTLSFTEDKICQESFLNNSRNSDCSSESEDDELLRQCIRQGMPGARRVVA